MTSLYVAKRVSVLQVFVDGLKKELPSCYTLYTDLPGHLASTSPPSTVLPISHPRQVDLGLQ